MQKSEVKRGNMYGDSIYQWNVIVGCDFGCSYCKSSFQRQMKRQKPIIDKNGRKRGCELCYHYIPHFHRDRLNNKLPKTSGDQFIWCCSSGDISFANPDWINQILLKVKYYKDRTFFFQTKNPECFNKYDFPENTILGITLETNRDFGYDKISKAPLPPKRIKDFCFIEHPHKIITIEPILRFDLFDMIDGCVQINPERIYIGYDTKKCYLQEPDLDETLLLIEELKMNLPNCKIKEKLIRPSWDEIIRSEIEDE